MMYRKLGRSGLKVSPICLGTMTFGGSTIETTADRIVGMAREFGVNFIDTADSYSGGLSEEIVGRAIRSDRARWIVATKVANPVRSSSEPNDRGLSRRHIIAACEASLARLGTDAIDIYYLHKEDHETPLDETVRAVGDLIRAGKIRYLGLSNYRAWRVAEICRICDELGLDRPVVSQPYYNALNRMPEVEHLPACGYFGLGVVPYSPLARGVLTGKYDPGRPAPEGTRASRKDKRMLETEWRHESLEIALEIRLHAEGKGLSAAQFAFGWVLANPFVTAAVAGPRTEQQWSHYLSCFDVALERVDEAFIDRLVPPGHPSTPGYNDPLYPLEGRPTGRATMTIDRALGHGGRETGAR